MAHFTWSNLQQIIQLLETQTIVERLFQLLETQTIVERLFQLFETQTIVENMRCTVKIKQQCGICIHEGSDQPGHLQSHQSVGCAHRERFGP